MYVRKFEADTIEEALKDIKRELGPDAIILKTLTNKGLKGAFKKKKIEITAAISEKTYTKKAHVDAVLTPDQKDEFYSGSSSYISNMIDRHEDSRGKTAAPATAQRANPGYGSLGLNKTVASTKNIANNLKNGLDDFLSLGEKESNTNSEFDFEEELLSAKAPANYSYEEVKNKPAPQTNRAEAVNNQAAQTKNYETRASMISEEIHERQKNRIEELEKKLYELTRNVEKIQKREPTGIYQLRTTLRSLEINDEFIQKIIKKALFELSENDVENVDLVFEFALREMMSVVQTGMPLFSSTDNKSPVVTIFVSESSSGQSSIVQKICALKSDSVIIKNDSRKIQKNNENAPSFAEKMFNMKVVHAGSIAEIVTETRKNLEEGKCVFIDYKCLESEVNETKKLVDGMRRSFPKVEVLITLSAIHSELYNKRIVATYRRLSDGIVATHLDACLNFGALFNVSEETRDLPYKFYGTGEVVPDDLEAATAERILAGLFKLS